jgi:hypothetical protein
MFFMWWRTSYYHIKEGGIGVLIVEKLYWIIHSFGDDSNGNNLLQLDGLCHSAE